MNILQIYSHNLALNTFVDFLVKNLQGLYFSLHMIREYNYRIPFFYFSTKYPSLNHNSISKNSMNF